MNWLLKIVSILMVIDAIVILAKPDYVKRNISLLAEGAKIYIAAVIDAVVGGVFLFGVSNKCDLPQVIIAFGILAMAGAVFIIAAPQKARNITAWFGRQNLFILRLFAIIYLLIGALLVYSA